MGNDNTESFEWKFNMKEYTKDSKLKEDIKIRKCNFDIDKRGGLKLFLLDDDDNYYSNNYISLQYIIDNDIKYTSFMLGVKEFIPIYVCKGVPKYLRYQEENKIYLLADFYSSSSIENPIYMALYNEYLRYKNKYVIWDGVVEKIKFSHFEVEDISQYPAKIYRYKTYNEIPEKYHGKVDYIYEIIEENASNDT